MTRTDHRIRGGKNRIMWKRYLVCWVLLSLSALFRSRCGFSFEGLDVVGCCVSDYWLFCFMNRRCDWRGIGRARLLRRTERGKGRVRRWDQRKVVLFKHPLSTRAKSYLNGYHSYRKLSLVYHPDRQRQEEDIALAKERFTMVKVWGGSVMSLHYTCVFVLM